MKHESVIEILNVFDRFTLNVPNQCFLGCFYKEKIFLAPQQEMRRPVFIRSSYKSHVNKVVILELSSFHHTKHIADHKCVIFTKLFYKSL